jgi:hypothetical protein
MKPRQFIGLFGLVAGCMVAGTCGGVGAHGDHQTKQRNLAADRNGPRKACRQDDVESSIERRRDQPDEGFQPFQRPRYR